MPHAASADAHLLACSNWTQCHTLTRTFAAAPASPCLRSVFEPTTNLSRVSERFASAEDIMPLVEADAAAAKGEGARAVALVAAWAVSAQRSASRAAKPFNPVLGESFEIVLQPRSEREGAAGADVQATTSLYLLAEQVSHQPPVSAVYADSDAFRYTATHRPATSTTLTSLKLLPNSVERVTLKASGHTFRIASPDHEIRNFMPAIVNGFSTATRDGSVWVDTLGELRVINETTGARAVVAFEPDDGAPVGAAGNGEGATGAFGATISAWLSGGDDGERRGQHAAEKVPERQQRVLRGHAWAAAEHYPDRPELRLCGVLGENLSAHIIDGIEGDDGAWCASGLEAPRRLNLWEHVSPASVDEDAGDAERKTLKERYALPEGVARQLLWRNAFGAVLNSDSRLRPDRAALSNAGKVGAADDSLEATLDEAAAQKRAIEERQREERKRREDGPIGTRGWRPRWFVPADEDDAEEVAHGSSGNTPPTELGFPAGAHLRAWEPSPGLLERSERMRAAAEPADVLPPDQQRARPEFAPW